MWAGSVVLGQRWAGRLVWLPLAAPRRAETPPAPGTYYTTRAGDLLDWIAWRFYGRTQGTVAVVLAANPGLAEWRPVLPGGLVVLLPPVAAEPDTVAGLWQGVSEPAANVPEALLTTREGDTLDWLCWRHYGAAAGAVETVLAANPGLGAWGPLLPQGVPVRLPPLPAAVEAQPPRLWD